MSILENKLKSSIKENSSGYNLFMNYKFVTLRERKIYH